MAAVYGIVCASMDQNTYHKNYFGILSYAVDHMLGRVEFVEVAEFGLEDLENRRRNELVKTLVAGDVLVVSNIHSLGRSTIEIIGILIEILKTGASVCAVDGEYDLGSNTKFRGLPCVLSVLSLAIKELELSRSKEPSNRKQADGAVVLGRPVGRLGVSRLDGRSEAIKSMIAIGKSKSAIARELGISRPALTDWLKSRMPV